MVLELVLNFFFSSVPIYLFIYKVVLEPTTNTHLPLGIMRAITTNIIITERATIASLRK